MSPRVLFPLLGALFATWGATRAGRGDLKLDLVQVFFRHSERTPYEDEAAYIGIEVATIYEPPDFSQLTRNGRKQSHKFGRLLRREYNDFLGDYDPREVHALSSVVNTPKMSLQLVLAGLYPPSPRRKWHPSLDWQPLPAYCLEPHESNLMFMPMVLASYERIFDEEFRKLQDYQEVLSGFSEFFQYVEENSGISLSNGFFRKSERFHFIFRFHEAQNLPLPAWCSNDTVTTMEELYVFGMRTMRMSPRIKRNSGGLVLKMIGDNMSRRDGSKIYMYGCHDVTLAALSYGLNIAGFDLPPFASSIIIEMYSDAEGRAYVRARSWNGLDEDFATLRIADCDEFCPMDEYLKIAEDVYLMDEELEYLKGES